MIVVTGASGLLGTIIAAKFASQKIPVMGLYRNTQPPVIDGMHWTESDVNDINALTDIFKGADCVVHAAAMVSFNQRNKDRMFKINVEGTTNVVTACLQTGVKRLIHVSSVAALEKKPNDKVIDEYNQWTDAGNQSNYGKTKHLAELEVLRGEAEGLSIAMVNPSIVLAAGNNHRSSGQIFSYINEERPFYTDGYVNYVDARDVADMIFKLTQDWKLEGRFIANAGTISWEELFQQMAKRMNKKPPYIKVNATLTRVAAAIEWVRSLVLGQEPMVTKETASLARQNVFYSNEKAIRELGMNFRSIADTLDWCCKPIEKNNGA